MLGKITRILLLMLLLSASVEVQAARVLNPVTDLCFQCVFPIKIGESPLGESGMTCTTAVAGGTKPVCTCPIPLPPYRRTGASVIFWEPARIIEVVRNAYTMPAFAKTSTSGKNIDKDNQPVNSELGGQNNYHVHYYYFPAKWILDAIIDSACLSTDSFDVAYLTEVDPLWNNDELSGLVNPEAAVFANMLAQLACAIDAVSSLYCSIDFMPWCMGSSGSSYPMTGHNQDSNPIQSTMAIAARMIYKLARQGLLLDPGVNICSPVMTPIWNKSHYRLQIAMPIRDITCHPIGQTSLLWEQKKTIPGIEDGYMVWMMWRKRGCCAY